MISVSHLRKSFGGVAVLKDVNAEIAKGEVISIIGPSGTGKSTFLRCLNRLETPDGGAIVVNGVDVTAPGADLAAIRRRMGMVFQNFNLFGNRNVLGNVTAAQCDILGVSGAAAKRKAMELLERVGLADLLAGREAVAPRHVDIQQHEIGLADEDRLQRLVAVGRATARITLRLQYPREVLPDLRLIVDDKDFAHDKVGEMSWSWRVVVTP